MINGKLIARIIGFLLNIIALFLLICALTSFLYKETACLAFLYSALINCVIGWCLIFYGWKAEKKFSLRDGYLVVVSTWVLCSFAGTLPFMIGGYVPSWSDAFFECMSAFTGTGMSCIKDIDSLPHSILIWRALMQWIGGLGIIFFTIAVLPLFGVTGVQLFAAEASGPVKDKLHPRIGVTSRRIWTLYIVLTLLETALLQLGGMPFFDSLCHSLSTTATGGFSTHQAGMALYDSAYIQYVISAFMFLSGLNFITMFLIISGHKRRLAQSDEIRWYTTSTLIATLCIAAALVFLSDRDVESAIRSAFFHVTSIHTSTGFNTEDLNSWPSCTWIIILFLMMSGACSGSTSGGVKCIRFVILFRALQNEFRRIIHPNAILPLRIGSNSLPTQVILTSILLIFLFILGNTLFSFILMESGYSGIGSISFSLSCFGNTGMALGEFSIGAGTILTPTLKWVSSFAMLLGRLELFTVLLLFTPQFWRGQ